MPKKRKFDYEEIKRQAAEAGTVQEFCEAARVSLAHFYTLKKKDERFRAAYEEGTAGGKYKPEDFYKWGRERLSNGEIAAHYKTSVIRINQLLKQKDLAEAYEKGKQGLEFDDEFSTVSILQANAPAENGSGGKDISGKLARLQTNIREAVRLGYETVLEISGYLGVEPQTVKNVLAELVKQQKLEKRTGENDFSTYHLPPAAEEKSNSVRERILRAIGEGNNLFRRITQATGLDGDTLLEELDYLLEDEDNGIELAYAGNLRCYFLRGQVPKGRLILDGDHGVRVADDEETKPPLMPSNHALEMLKRPAVNSEPLPPQTAGVPTLPEEPGEGNGKKNIPWLKEMFEQFGREGKSVSQIAEQFNVTYQSVRGQLLKPEFKAAYERGKINNDPETAAEIISGVEQNEPLDEDAPVETVAADEIVEEEVSAEEGKVSVDPRFENTLEHLKQTSPASEKGIERVRQNLETLGGDGRGKELFVPEQRGTVKNGFVFVEVDAGRPPAQKRSVGLSAGAVELSSDFNFFDTDAKDRRFLCRLMDLVEEFENGGDSSGDQKGNAPAASAAE